MRIIRTAESMAAVRRLPLHADLQLFLVRHAAILDEHCDDIDIAIIVIEAGDTCAQTEMACGKRLVTDGSFAFPVEVVARHGQWAEVVWITSDDGSGIVLLIQLAATTDPELLSAFNNAMADAAASADFTVTNLRTS